MRSIFVVTMAAVTIGGLVVVSPILGGSSDPDFAGPVVRRAFHERLQRLEETLFRSVSGVVRFEKAYLDLSENETHANDGWFEAVRKIQFNPPFDRTPLISVSLTMVEGNHNVVARPDVEAFVHNETAEGMEIRLMARNKEAFNRVDVSYMVVPLPASVTSKHHPYGEPGVHGGDIDCMVIVDGKVAQEAKAMQHE